MESYTKTLARKRALQQKCRRIDSDLKHVLVKWDQKKEVYQKDLFNIKARTIKFKETLAMFGKDSLLGASQSSLTETAPYEICTPDDLGSEEKRKRRKYRPRPGGRFVPEKQREINEAKQHEQNMEMMSTGNKMRIRKAHAIAQNLETIDIQKSESLKYSSEKPWGSSEDVSSNLRKLRRGGNNTRLPPIPSNANKNESESINT